MTLKETLDKVANVLQNATEGRMDTFEMRQSMYALRSLLPLLDAGVSDTELDNLVTHAWRGMQISAMPDEMAFKAIVSITLRTVLDRTLLAKAQQDREYRGAVGKVLEFASRPSSSTGCLFCHRPQCSPLCPIGRLAAIHAKEEL